MIQRRGMQRKKTHTNGSPTTTILGWEIVALGVVRSLDSTLALTAT